MIFSMDCLERTLYYTKEMTCNFFYELSISDLFWLLYLFGKNCCTYLRKVEDYYSSFIVIEFECPIPSIPLNLVSPTDE